MAFPTQYDPDLLTENIEKITIKNIRNKEATRQNELIYEKSSVSPVKTALRRKFIEFKHTCIIETPNRATGKIQKQRKTYKYYLSVNCLASIMRYLVNENAIELSLDEKFFCCCYRVDRKRLKELSIIYIKLFDEKHGKLLCDELSNKFEADILFITHSYATIQIHEENKKIYEYINKSINGDDFIGSVVERTELLDLACKAIQDMKEEDINSVFGFSNNTETP